ncbi:sucrose-phosphate synthase, putative, glycosyltransferase domain-containing protein [Anaerovirgula multivorans]|uniref:sucrose-phosphate synthase n=1 Tax=Anaerovirgula multivorans TaxID=312168 RepID=A0A239BER2_9FIRM|nr:PfkB family carbohydrate kinase [Anaerovirgula multivorans]SNS06525.1 sucrose-phosphate synthase, putative, glycosyltransferase domain-containing protein [Anaerovirgula multivorans]
MDHIIFRNWEEKTYDVVVIGEILIDMISEEYTEDFNCDIYKKYFGGSPANIAMNTKNLGLNSSIISCVGNDGLGVFLLEQMKQRGIDISNVQISENPTSMVLLTKSQGSPIPIFYRGADYQIHLNETIEEIIKKTKIIHFSTWPISKEPSRSAIEKIIEIAKANNTLVAFDPNYHPALWEKEYDSIQYVKEIIKKVDIIKPSEDDARRLFGEGTIEEYLNKYINLGPKLVVMTLGKEGLIASDGKEYIRLSTMADRVADATGAGDAFYSGFYAGIIKGFQIKKAIELGNATSAYKLKYTGAVVDLPKIEEIQRLYNLWGDKTMHVIFLNPQGNFDKKDSYWTEHPDFGGQLVYVKEIACAMAKQGHRVDILTRQIIDEDWPEFADEFDQYDGVENLRIIRIPAGQKEFLQKELLWEYLSEWVDNIINFYQEEGDMPDFVTTHYGDGGIAGAIMYQRTGIPFSFTAHSLGAQKMDKLGVDITNMEEMEKKYHFTKRIMAERIAMANSAINFVSTSQERDEQYTHLTYKGAGDMDNPQKFRVVAPGANTEVFSATKGNKEDKVVAQFIKEMFQRDLDKDRQELPAIIAASRLDPKKNHVGLVKAFAKNKELQQKANLVITLRGIENAFEDYSFVKSHEKEILDGIMEIIDEYQLYGKVSMFSINSQGQLAACYRQLASYNSIFCLTAVHEPFGLAPIEAMSCGLPAVVTKYGGPSEVLYEDGEEYGVLIDPFNSQDIAKGILKVLENYSFYKKQGIQRVKSKYTWDATAANYVKAIEEILENKKDDRNMEIHPYFLDLSNENTIGLDWLEKVYLGGEVNVGV